MISRGLQPLPYVVSTLNFLFILLLDFKDQQMFATLPNIVISIWNYACRSTIKRKVDSLSNPC